MKDFVGLLAERLKLKIGFSEYVGLGVIDEGIDCYKFYIPKFVTRAGVTRLDGYLGIFPSNKDKEKNIVPIEVTEAWSFNILNLPWILPDLYFNKDDVESGVSRFAPALREALDLLPSEIEGFTPLRPMPAGSSWRQDRRAWLLGRLSQRDRT